MKHEFHSSLITKDWYMWFNNFKNNYPQNKAFLRKTLILFTISKSMTYDTM